MDIERLESIFRRDFKPKKYSGYPFPEIEKIDGKRGVVFDRNFSFLYYDIYNFKKKKALGRRVGGFNSEFPNNGWNGLRKVPSKEKD